MVKARGAITAKASVIELEHPVSFEDENFQKMW